MKISIIVNYSKENAKSCSDEIVRILSEKNCILGSYEYDYDGKYPKEVYDCDVIIAIGGDGTIIHTAKVAAKKSIKILGVNVGSLGFTASMECSEFLYLDKLLAGNYTTENRMMIEADIITKGEIINLTALNDIVLSGGVSQIIEYKISLGGDNIYKYRADGFIISTPTGSTAYALSAGGPVIEPSMKCIEYTPICPHSLFNRSVIFSEDTVVRAWISKKNSEDVFLSADGGKNIKLGLKDEIIFKKLNYQADFIKFDNKNFYDILNRKIITIQ